MLRPLPFGISLGLEVGVRGGRGCGGGEGGSQVAFVDARGDEEAPRVFADLGSSSLFCCCCCCFCCCLLCHAGDDVGGTMHWEAWRAEVFVLPTVFMFSDKILTLRRDAGVFLWQSRLVHITPHTFGTRGRGAGADGCLICELIFEWRAGDAVASQQGYYSPGGLGVCSSIYFFCVGAVYGVAG